MRVALKAHTCRARAPELQRPGESRRAAGMTESMVPVVGRAEVVAELQPVPAGDRWRTAAREGQV